MSRSVRPLVLILLLSLAAAPALGAKRAKAKDLLLPSGWPDLDEAHVALAEVDYAKGAPAVVLLECLEHEWEQIKFKRDRYFRRVKILNEDGVERHGNFDFHLWGDWRVQKVQARTILPDGQIIDAEQNINRDRSDEGLEVIKITFPQVQVGAILDLDVRMNTNGLGMHPYTVQEQIPVLESRLIMVPPIGLLFRVVPMRLPPEKSKPDGSFNIAGGKRAHVWQFENVPALPDEANLPPLDDISQTLFVILQSYKDSSVYFPIASDWKTWNEVEQEYWDDWMKKRHAEATALAKQLAEGRSTAVDKAEAIRQGLKERFEVKWVHDAYTEDSPDELLAKGSGTSGELAALTAHMLRAVGVDAVLAGIRRRSDGMVPTQFPVPSLFNDVMVRIPDDDDFVFFSPAADLHVTRLPYDCSGVLAMLFDGESEAPVAIPDFRSSDNQALRTVEATLSETGDLTASSTETYRGVAAELWRNRLKDHSEDEQKRRIEQALRRELPGAVLQEFEIANLDDASKDLVLENKFSVEGFATRAGQRLIFNSNLYDQIASADWAPESRQYDVDMRRTSDTQDTVFFKLPPGVGEIEVPERAKLDAGQVGLYETTYERRGQVLVTKRRMRLDVYRIAAQYYAELRNWFSAIATIDEKPVVLAMR